LILLDGTRYPVQKMNKLLLFFCIAACAFVPAKCDQRKLLRGRGAVPLALEAEAGWGGSNWEPSAEQSREYRENEDKIREAERELGGSEWERAEKANELLKGAAQELLELRAHHAHDHKMLAKLERAAHLAKDAAHWLHKGQFLRLRIPIAKDGTIYSFLTLTGGSEKETRKVEPIIEKILNAWKLLDPYDWDANISGTEISENIEKELDEKIEKYKRDKEDDISDDFAKEEQPSIPKQIISKKPKLLPKH